MVKGTRVSCGELFQQGGRGNGELRKIALILVAFSVVPLYSGSMPSRFIAKLEVTP